jgi:hypothetical protein
MTAHTHCHHRQATASCTSVSNPPKRQASLGSKLQLYKGTKLNKQHKVWSALLRPSKTHQAQPQAASIPPGRHCMPVSCCHHLPLQWQGNTPRPSKLQPLPKRRGSQGACMDPCEGHTIQHAILLKPRTSQCRSAETATRHTSSFRLDMRKVSALCSIQHSSCSSCLTQRTNTVTAQASSITRAHCAQPRPHGHICVLSMHQAPGLSRHQSDQNNTTVALIS